METTKIENINMHSIYSHPDNPRKNLGDISELTESIKKNGVMQNLTVMEGHWDESNNWCEDGFTLLIGHRRCAAAKMAGIETMPCRIVKSMTKKEQVAIMLEENMQRNDLTIWEQAQGFQMMLDLGETEDTIAEKTGFSRTTVKHRLNIAKLDSDLLNEKNGDEAFQLSLTDLYALEQLEDIELRNKILKEASSSKELLWRTKQANQEIKRTKRAEDIIRLLEDAGLKPAPKKVENEMYSGKWESVKVFSLDADDIPKIKKKEVEGCMYIKWYREVKVIKEKKKDNEPKTPQELENMKRKEDAQKIKEIAKEMAGQREECIRSILSGKTSPLKNTEKVMEKLWNTLVFANGYIGKISMARFLLNTKKNWYDLSEQEKQESLETVEKQSLLHQLMITAFIATQDLTLCDYNNSYKNDAGKAVTAITEALSEYGFAYAEEEQYKIMEGSHPLYKQD